MDTDNKTLEERCKEIGIKPGQHIYRMAQAGSALRASDGTRYLDTGKGIRRVDPKPLKKKARRKMARTGKG